MAVEPNIAAGGFITLLEKLREVFLQDAARLRQECPNHPMFKNVLFNHPEFELFAAALIAAEKILVADEDPHLVAIEKTIPAGSDRLRTLTGVL
ncbi:hypothetical protein BJ878DRAFT_547728 [Calycina marina]|uniref:Ndc10 domain-containing protein n=1 Tax=Calycina marina TaxID=1763456 RepID=A0A9P7Z4R0_9HELO|nr:hypothetical protein BJ878DRAFT_547728 [Calycina marina]